MVVLPSRNCSHRNCASFGEKSTWFEVKPLLAARWTAGLHEGWNTSSSSSYLPACYLWWSLADKRRTFVKGRLCVCEFGIENKCNPVLIKSKWRGELTSHLGRSVFVTEFVWGVYVTVQQWWLEELALVGIGCLNATGKSLNTVLTQGNSQDGHGLLKQFHQPLNRMSLCFNKTFFLQNTYWILDCRHIWK